MKIQQQSIIQDTDSLILALTHSQALYILFKWGSVGVVLDRGSEWEIEGPNSNFSLLRYIQLCTTTIEKYGYIYSFPTMG